MSKSQWVFRHQATLSHKLMSSLLTSVSRMLCRAGSPCHCRLCWRHETLTLPVSIVRSHGRCAHMWLQQLNKTENVFTTQWTRVARSSSHLRHPPLHVHNKYSIFHNSYLTLIQRLWYFCWQGCKILTWWRSNISSRQMLQLSNSSSFFSDLIVFFISLLVSIS